MIFWVDSQRLGVKKYIAFMVANRLTELIQNARNGVNHALFLNLSHKTHSQKFKINSIYYNLVQFFYYISTIFYYFSSFFEKLLYKIIFATNIEQIVQFNTYILNFAINLFNL